MTEPEAEEFIDLLLNVKPQDMSLIYGDKLLKVLSRFIRSLIKAPPGYKFICADFSSIEAVGTPWVAGEKEILETIRQGLDQYKVAARGMFKVDYDKVSKRERQAGKITVLACGYGGGENALRSMAESYGLTFTEAERMQYVQAFRDSRPRLTQTWTAFKRAAFHTTHTLEPTRVDMCPAPIVFHKKDDAICLRLPSGRDLYYQKATILNQGTPWGSRTPMVTCRDPKTGLRKSMTGGNLFQNVVQAVCRDLLMEAQLRLERAGYKIIMSIHDECLAVVPDENRYNLDEFINIMTEVPSWAAEFPIKADGWEGYRYHK
jgi:DNA polymerase